VYDSSISNISRYFGILDMPLIM